MVVGACVCVCVLFRVPPCGWFSGETKRKTQFWGPFMGVSINTDVARTSPFLSAQDSEQPPLKTTRKETNHLQRATMAGNNHLVSNPQFQTKT